MQAFSVVVLVVLFGAALGQVRRLRADIAKQCQKEHGLTDSELYAADTHRFDDLSAKQKDMLWCYAKKINAMDENGYIYPENIPFSTPARLEECKAKIGLVLTRDDFMGYVLCIFRRSMSVCGIVAEMDKSA